MGYADSAERIGAGGLRADYQHKTELNRKILDHLLHDAFGDDAETEPEVDLVLDPDPPAERDRSSAGAVSVSRRAAGVQNLMTLSTEKIRFLSTRRCRHFLASIAPRLLDGDRRHARPRSDAREPEQSQRFARRQGGAVGAVQFQSAVAAVVRRVVLVEPVFCRAF